MNSKELLEQTGISRATLNNYIALGIVPKPDVLPPEPHDGAAPRIGYFPEDTVARIVEIQRLKNQGWSMAAIAEHFAPGSASGARAAAAGSARPEAAVPPVVAPQAVHRRSAPGVSLDDIQQPAYLVDPGFAIAWTNAAGATVLGRPDSADGVFRSLLAGQVPGRAREQALRFHMALAKRQGVSLTRLIGGLAGDEEEAVRRAYDESPAAPAALVCHAPLEAEPGAAPTWIYAVQFREGLLFVHGPRARAFDELPGLLAAGEAPAAESRRRRPILSDVAVVALELHDAARIWSALPAEEYFELINQIWLTAEPIFRRHHGTNGKHPGDGMVCYFLPQNDSSYAWNALLAAHEMRDAMRRVSKEWQLRKGWTTELYLNSGLDEGQQWLGPLQAGGPAQFTMFGDTLNRAARISDFARFGAIWATKNLVVKLAPDEKQRLRYGVHRRDKEGRDVFVASVFSTVDRLAEVNGTLHPRLQDIARVPITEILDIAPTDRPRERAADLRPT